MKGGQELYLPATASLHQDAQMPCRSLEHTRKRPWPCLRKTLVDENNCWAASDLSIERQLVQHVRAFKDPLEKQVIPMSNSQQPQNTPCAPKSSVHAAHKASTCTLHGWRCNACTINTPAVDNNAVSASTRRTPLRLRIPHVEVPWSMADRSLLKYIRCRLPDVQLAQKDTANMSQLDNAHHARWQLARHTCATRQVRKPFSPQQRPLVYMTACRHELSQDSRLP